MIKLSSPVVQGGWFETFLNLGFYLGALLLNRGETTADISLDFASVWASGSLTVRDLWAEEDVGQFTGRYTAKAVPSHGNVALTLRKTEQ